LLRRNAAERGRSGWLSAMGREVFHSEDIDAGGAGGAGGAGDGMGGSPGVRQSLRAAALERRPIGWNRSAVQPIGFCGRVAARACRGRLRRPRHPGGAKLREATRTPGDQ
jgi:hypothetical protein